ncbi:hypothetical protein RRG08_063220 [Elysia crispata]|uniref:Uncharacterized protein n=1 Tax=Elysia crispata TaxID=231223 RepID=A0AAE0YA98_9GAST|nr:hypothetical protein RRG08_063220 [Elysia crispata]
MVVLLTTVIIDCTEDCQCHILETDKPGDGGLANHCHYRLYRRLSVSHIGNRSSDGSQSLMTVPVYLRTLQAGAKLLRMATLCASNASR